ncbi:biosynthetic arginine decarboxylase [Ferrimonas sp. YFM]|uniref:biosynthetic arginine decarboxylase n=1 Tax=Ferrimonas sp. YFM TaxID=3028878 RepID=UPI002572603C|nr:biosynthetic arginine decarboxylase [Ferrimonas sp. YFM]BDY03403.1 biosynthetic arginine decarboxylase [Ferrimonas sp. YFM]
MSWSSRDAHQLYNVPYWGRGYYGVNGEGQVEVRPNPANPQISLSLSKLTEQLIQDRGAQLPMLVRFPQILHSQVQGLCSAFTTAISEYGYQGQYLAVYPIKVNQQRTVVQELLAGGGQSLGLEAGSKPELLAVLAMAQDSAQVIVCNGYKDREYVRLALRGQQLGYQVFLVIEKMSEMQLVLEEAEALGVSPLLGVRARLASQGKGKWQASGGEKSKFGLSAAQILKLVETLRESGRLECLQLLHFHLGSQIANIRDIQKGLTECGRFYMELRKLGAPITTVDVGGGLGVDYEGTRSQSNCSVNYSLQEYANNVVYAIGDVCRQYHLPHPRLISESGRAMTAHHAVLIGDVIGVEAYEPETLPPPGNGAPLVLKNMWQTLQEVREHTDARALGETYHDTVNDLADVHAKYNYGLLDLSQRAWAEQVHLQVCYEVSKELSPKNRSHRPIIDELNEKLADKFFVNFSLFQSLPDAWGIDQVFPVLPLSGLESKPDRRAVILDITCDSDGTIDQYVDGQGIETTLPMPAWSAEHPYHVAFFMVGAYQEILGDMHNLFADTDVVDIKLQDDGEIEVVEYLPGTRVNEVLEYVNLDPEWMLERYRSRLESCSLADGQRDEALIDLEQGLVGYTYLEP